MTAEAMSRVIAYVAANPGISLKEGAYIAAGEASMVHGYSVVKAAMRRKHLICLDQGYGRQLFPGDWLIYLDEMGLRPDHTNDDESES
jgi:hypothetical protein